jgi:glycosyltransferase involved in cell wall biosynthesis
MSLSIALCTYNGERYLPAQLQSIAAQTRRPEEVVVCDDGSTDGTWGLLEEFRASAPFEVRLQRNAKNLRSTLNFAQAIEMCRGEVTALCDQDDVWHAEKLEVLARELEKHPEAAMVFSDANLVSEQLAPLGYTAWQSIGLSRRKRRWIEQGAAARVFLSQYVVTGATMAFRSSYRDLVLPIPANWVHDAWIAFLLAAVAPARMVNRPLIDYRQHATQQIGLRKLGPFGLYRLAQSLRATSFQSLHDQFAAAYIRLKTDPHADEKFVEGLERKLEHLLRRHRIRQRRPISLPAIVVETLRGGYFRYSYGWKSVLQDLLF